MWEYGSSNPSAEDSCVIYSSFLAPPPSTPVVEFSIVSCTYETNGSQSSNPKVEIRNTYLKWTIPSKPNAELTDLHFQIWFGLDLITNPAEDVHDIVNISSSPDEVKI